MQALYQRMPETDAYSILCLSNREVEGELCPAGMLLDDKVLQGPSPPPTGAVNDVELDDPISATKTELRIQRNSHQLAHWRSLIAKFPNDPLHAFWREQCTTLEGLLVQRQRVGQKRPAFDDDAMDDEWCKRPCHA
jgi:hypothetical protein